MEPPEQNESRNDGEDGEQCGLGCVRSQPRQERRQWAWVILGGEQAVHLGDIGSSESHLDSR
jgi:hypothetical protein